MQMLIAGGARIDAVNRVSICTEHSYVNALLHNETREELLMATTDVSACLYSVRGACIYLEEIVRTCSYVKQASYAYRYMIHAYLHQGMHACIHFCLCALANRETSLLHIIEWEIWGLPYYGCVQV